MSQHTLDRACLSHQADAFKIENTMVYQILFKVFTNMGALVYVKQRRGMQVSQAVFFDVHKHFLCPDHVARHAADAEGKLQNSHYDRERNSWDWDKFVVLHKEQHVIMESLTDYGNSGMDNCNKVHYFLQGIKSSELEAAFIVSTPNQNSMAQILMLPCLIWAKWSCRKS